MRLRPQLCARKPILGTRSTATLWARSTAGRSSEIDSVRAVLIANTDRCYENRTGSGDTGKKTLGRKRFPWFHRGLRRVGRLRLQGAVFSRGKTAVASARTGNVIGGGDWEEGELVPEIVRDIASGKQIVMEAAPVPPEMWQHVLEPARAHLLLAKMLFDQGQEFSGAWEMPPQPRCNHAAKARGESCRALGRG